MGIKGYITLSVLSGMLVASTMELGKYAADPFSYAFCDNYISMGENRKVAFLGRELKRYAAASDESSKDAVEKVMRSTMESIISSRYRDAEPEEGFTEDPLGLKVEVKKNDAGRLEAFLVDDRSERRLPINYLNQCGDIDYRWRGIVREVVDDIKYPPTDTDKRSDYRLAVIQRESEALLKDIREGF